MHLFTWLFELSQLISTNISRTVLQDISFETGLAAIVSVVILCRNALFACAVSDLLLSHIDSTVLEDKHCTLTQITGKTRHTGC